MSSLKDSIAPLESHLKSVPMQIGVYQDLPFAIMRYDPSDEWELRREIKLLATRLEAVGKEVHIIPMSELLWSALEQVHAKDDEEGLNAVIALEKNRGYVEAQQQVTTYLSSKVWVPLWDLLAERLSSFNPDTSCGSNVARHFSHVDVARQDARQNQGAHDLVLSRLHRRHDGVAFHGPEGPGCVRQLPSQNLRLRQRYPT